MENFSAAFRLILNPSAAFYLSVKSFAWDLHNKQSAPPSPLIFVLNFRSLIVSFMWQHSWIFWSPTNIWIPSEFTFFRTASVSVITNCWRSASVSFSLIRCLGLRDLAEFETGLHQTSSSWCLTFCVSLRDIMPYWKILWLSSALLST